MSWWTRGAVASAVAATSLLSACEAGDVSIESPSLSDQDRATCARFLDEVPTTLTGEKARTLTPANALGAAWGDPAITLTCGVSLPAGFDQFASCTEVNGVGWFIPLEAAEDPSSDVTVTAAGYRPIVQVEIPATYRPEGVASVITELATVVEGNLKLVKPCL